MFCASAVISQGRPLPLNPETWIDADKMENGILFDTTMQTDIFFQFNQLVDFINGQTDNEVKLIFPHGRFSMQALLVTFAKNMKLWGYGSQLFVGLVVSEWGTKATTPQGITGLYHALVQQVEVGDNAFTLIDSGDASKFAVGDWICLGGLEMQGSNGYPPNWHYNQFGQITDITAGVVTTTLTARDTYKTDWPDTTGDYDSEGRAAIHRVFNDEYPNIRDIYGRTQEFYGFRITQNTGQFQHQLQNQGLYTRYHDMLIEDTQCFPSFNRTYVVEGGATFNSKPLENDKLVEYILYKDVSKRASPTFEPTNTVQSQSSSAHTCVIDNSHITNIQGTTRRMKVLPGTEAGILFFGPWGYGSSDKLISIHSTPERPTIIPGAGDNILQNWYPLTDFTNYVNGVFQYIGASGPLRFTPGLAMVSWKGGGEVINLDSFNILNITEDITGTFMHTDLPATLPNYAAMATGFPVFVMNPAPFVKSTGTPRVLDTLTVSDTPRPIWSYFNYTTNGTETFGGVFGSARQFGRVTIDPYSLKIDVTQAATTVGDCDLQLNVLVCDPNLNDSNSGIIIDMKAAGTRIIDSTGVTGAQPGDSFDTVFTTGGEWRPSEIRLTWLNNVAATPLAQHPIATIIFSTDHSSPYS